MPFKQQVMVLLAGIYYPEGYRIAVSVLLIFQIAAELREAVMSIEPS